MIMDKKSENASLLSQWLIEVIRGGSGCKPDGMRIVEDHQSHSRNNRALTFTRRRFLPRFPGDN